MYNTFKCINGLLILLLNCCCWRCHCRCRCRWCCCYCYYFVFLLLNIVLLPVVCCIYRHIYFTVDLMCSVATANMHVAEVWGFESASPRNFQSAECTLLLLSIRWKQKCYACNTVCCAFYFILWYWDGCTVVGVSIEIICTVKYIDVLIAKITRIKCLIHDLYIKIMLKLLYFRFNRCIYESSCLASVTLYTRLTKSVLPNVFY